MCGFKKRDSSQGYSLYLMDDQLSYFTNYVSHSKTGDLNADMRKDHKDVKPHWNFLILWFWSSITSYKIIYRGGGSYFPYFMHTFSLHMHKPDGIAYWREGFFSFLTINFLTHKLMNQNSSSAYLSGIFFNCIYLFILVGDRVGKRLFIINTNLDYF